MRSTHGQDADSTLSGLSRHADQGTSQHTSRPLARTGAAFARLERSLARLPRIVVLGIVGLVVAALLMPVISTTAAAQSSAWSAGFAGKPSAPAPFNPTDWDVQVHSRDRETWKTLESIDAHHGSNCAGHPSTHAVSSYENAVFQCNEHMMTAINAGGYGLIALTPNQMVDFKDGEAVVSFDMSTFRSSTRDFISLWVTPYNDQIPLPLTDWLPDLTGEPRSSVHIQMDQFNGNTVFRGETIKNFAATNITTDGWTGYETFLTPSAIRRDRFELRISRTSVKFGMPAYDKWWVSKNVPDLGWDRGIVQFGHHSYNPEKACDYDGTCAPNTWHWDNVNISNAVPFTMLKADLPYVDASTRAYVTVPQPAPANSYLRFSGIGSNLQVSYNGGQTWQNAQMHAVEQVAEEHFKPYWMAVPAGTTRVDFRGSSWWGGNWMVRGISIWNESASASAPPATATSAPVTSTPVTATPVPSATATTTTTAVPTTTTTATTTATVVPTSTMTAVPTSTRVPTSTVAPTSTAAPATFTTSATTSPSVAAGSTASISAAVTSASATTVLVDVEIYSAAGAKVHQQFFDNQAFAAGQKRNYPVSWAVPANLTPGTYTVVVGVFSAGWGTNYVWNSEAATVTVAANSTTTQPTLPPPSSACSPRPTTTVQTQVAGTGRMQATIQVGRPAGATGNIVRKIRVGNIRNAEVEILGQTFNAQNDGASLVPTTASQTVTITVTRQASRAGQAVTVPLTITDDCGEWQTFVGGGANSFGG